MYETALIYKNRLVELDSVALKPSNGIIIRIENEHPLYEDLMEDELAAIVVAIEVYRCMKNRDGGNYGHNGHNGGGLHSRWLVEWMLETTESDPLKHHTNGVSNRMELINSSYETHKFWCRLASFPNHNQYNGH